MQTTYIKFLKKTLLFTSMCMVLAGTLFTTSCKKEEGTNGVTILNSFGPSPVARGAELRFIGENLDKVDTIILPGNIVIASPAFGVKTSTLISITVPQNAVPGTIILKTPDGPITTKTTLGFSEPISIANFSPASAKMDSLITITGDYLNLIKQVIFTSNVAVDQKDFVSQTRYQIKVKVPAAAQTGKISVSNGADNPIIVYSANTLTLTLPGITSVLPNPVKAGTNLTITGTDLDLVMTVVFGGNKRVTTFESKTLTQLVVAVPADAQDDTLQIIPASGVVIKASSKLILVVPVVSVTPTAVKNGADLTVTGTNLDLVDHVTFGGNVNGTIKVGGTATQILVTVPNTAVTGSVNFVTKANKTVSGGSVTIVDPVFTSFSPASAKANATVSITGTDLDLVTSVKFTGGLSGTIGSGRTSTQLDVTVPVGAKTGNITLVTLNGNQVPSPTAFTVLANLPTITSFTEPKGAPGQILTINGTSLSLIKQLIFPGNIVATDYGTKTDTKVEVYVPATTTWGPGSITMVTYEGEQGLTPQIFIGSVDPVADLSLVITDCTNKDIPGNWSGNIEVITAPSQSAYFGNVVHGTATALTGWGWIWGNNWYTFPTVTTANYLFKVDVNITKAMGTGVHFQMEFGGSRIDLGSFGVADGATTNGWKTVTYDLTAIGGLPATIPSNGEWGVNFWYATGAVDASGLYMDNFRFEHK